MSAAAEAALKLRRARRSGNGWVACCPVHDDHQPSLSLRDGDGGRLLVKCFAGCDSSDVLRAIGPDFSPGRQGRDNAQSAAAQEAARREAEGRSERARAIWHETIPADADSPVAAYLRARGYFGPVPPTVRYHPSLRHPTGLYFPALVAAVAVWPSHKVTAVQRIYLSRDGSGKAGVEPAKPILGPVTGGAVRLAAAGPALALAEGIETALASMAGSGLPTWAALSAGGIEALVLPPPPLASDILIGVDNDKSGRGFSAAETAAARWIAEGRRVRYSEPPEVGTDWADFPTIPEIRGAA